MPDEPQADTGEAVIDAPSAAEVTAALEALGGGNDSDAEDSCSGCHGHRLRG